MERRVYIFVPNINAAIRVVEEEYRYVCRSGLLIIGPREEPERERDVLVQPGARAEYRTSKYIVDFYGEGCTRDGVPYAAVILVAVQQQTSDSD